MKRIQKRQAGLMSALLGVALLSSATASAQNVCFPRPGYVPLLPGEPTWNNQMFARTDLNEPRWGNSPLTQFSNDMGEDGVSNGGFRMILSPDGKTLSVSIQNKADKRFESVNAVSFGIYPQAKPPVAFTIGAPTGPDPNFSAIVTTHTWNGRDPNTKIARWNNSLAKPTWLTDVAIWTANEPNNANRTEVGGADWAVQFKIDLTAISIDSASTKFKFSLGMQMMKMRAPNIDNPTVIEDYVAEVTLPGYMPITPRPENTYITDSMIRIDPELWFLYGVGPATDTTDWSTGKNMAAPCVKGIAVTRFGTVGGDNATVDANPNARNTWFADLITEDENVTPLSRNSVEGRFRVANFGSQPNLPSHLAPWNPIKPAPLNPVPPPPANPNPTPTNGNYLSTTASRIEFACTQNSAAPVSTVCGIPKPNVGFPSQCAVVELTPAFGYQNLSISKPTTYNNMQFVGLSRKDVIAELSIKGLKALTGVDRDRVVIMDVITRNMPQWGNLPIFLDTYLMNLLKTALLGLSQLFNPFDRSLGAKDLMRIAWPTYETHTYYETGWSRTYKGKSYKVAWPMNSYGMYLYHEGVLFGYSHGLGPTLVDKTFGEFPANSKTYRLRIASESTKQVKSGVATEDAPKLFSDAVQRVCQLFPYACGRYE